MYNAFLIIHERNSSSTVVRFWPQFDWTSTPAEIRLRFGWTATLVGPQSKSNPIMAANTVATDNRDRPQLWLRSGRMDGGGDFDGFRWLGYSVHRSDNTRRHYDVFSVIVQSCKSDGRVAIAHAHWWVTQGISSLHLYM